MSKVFRKVVTIAVAMVMVFSVAKSASANESTSVIEYDWSAIKTPGNTDSTSQDVDMSVYTGEISFKVTTLTGNCSYLAAHAVSAFPNKYYIDNTSRSILISKVNGEQSFEMKFVNFSINGGEKMYIRCSLAHNASISDTVYGKGILYHYGK